MLPAILNIPNQSKDKEKNLYYILNQWISENEYEKIFVQTFTYIVYTYN